MINHCCYIAPSGLECAFVAAFEVRGVGFEDNTHACIRHLHLLAGDEDEVHIVTGPDGTYEQNVYEMAYGASDQRWRGKSVFLMSEMTS